MELIEESKDVLLYYSPTKKWIINVKKGLKFHTHLGIIDIDEIINKPYGVAIISNKGKKLYVLKPTIYDLIFKSKRKTQIVYPKDLGYIIARTGLGSNEIAIEIGTGSGALTTFLANIVKPNGHVYTYDINEEFVNIAKSNVRKAKLEEYVTFNIKDIRNEKLESHIADLVTIDLGDPWNVIDIVKNILKPSKMLVSICPTMNQAEKLSMVLKDGFIDIECNEIMIRTIEAREGMTRPAFRMIGHTTYLVFARRLYDSSK
jgi:tRNA (adenine57-N1/adenine58-N1)-methyltransferase